ncbi:MAG TPA: response regulator [Steroidobacteraceae bacterium]|jgi:FixJ family two-component response regulator
MAPSTVYVVDDDPGIRRALERLLGAAGFRSLTFGSATAYLAGEDPEVAGCVVLDVTLPDLDGLGLQRRMAESGRDRPIVFISACGSIPLSVRAMRAGAVTFLTKPVTERELLPAVREAVAIDRQWRRAREDRSVVQAHIGSLTPREREVMEHIVKGLLNKQIAAALGTVEQTVKVHRARVMKKMAARSVAELVRLATLAWSWPAHSVPVPDRREPRSDNN